MLWYITNIFIYILTFNVKTTNHFIQSYIETFVITVALGYEEGLKKKNESQK